MFVRIPSEKVICTEYMAVSVGSTFDSVLPFARQQKVGAINWGFVAGKTQHTCHGSSREHPYIFEQPTSTGGNRFDSAAYWKGIAARRSAGMTAGDMMPL
jgi:hypothetical protein